MVFDNKKLLATSHLLLARKPKPFTTEDTHSTPLSQAQGRSGQATERRGIISGAYAKRGELAEVYANLG
jgi:hypothetical protein